MSSLFSFVENGQHPENCVNEVRQKDRTFYIRLKNTQS
jgi:hypothetical protein